jgi:hypothetical protein
MLPKLRRSRGSPSGGSERFCSIGSFAVRISLEVRLVLGLGVSELPSALSREAEEFLRRGRLFVLRKRQHLREDEGRSLELAGRHRAPPLFHHLCDASAGCRRSTAASSPRCRRATGIRREYHHEASEILALTDFEAHRPSKADIHRRPACDHPSVSDFRDRQRDVRGNLQGFTLEEFRRFGGSHVERKELDVDRIAARARSVPEVANRDAERDAKFAMTNVDAFEDARADRLRNRSLGDGP